MKSRDTLQAAMGSGEVLFVKYHGGSKPGTSRQLAPTSFVGKDKVRAFCVASNRNKLFIVSKIEIIKSADHSQRDYETAPLPRVPKTLAEALDHQLDRIQIIGWHICRGEDYCTLHRFFKNGKYRKTPVISINYDEFTIDSYYDVDTDDFVDTKRKSKRPWCVRYREGDYSASFTSPGAAAKKFIDIASTVPVAK